MKEQLMRLIELQQMESAAGKIHAKRKNIPIQLNALEDEYKLYQANTDAQRDQLERMRKRRQEMDAQLLAGQEALKRTRERLFEVKTNKEYQSMLKEIENFEEKNSGLEDEVISILDDLDRLETEMKTAEAELEVQRQRYDQGKKKMQAELDSLAVELDVCIRKSDELKKDIPADMLRKYEQIKNIGRGVAVVAVWKEICDGCHMAIPPQLYNEVQKSTTLITCPNCNRIIYWENRNVVTSQRNHLNELPEQNG